MNSDHSKQSRRAKEKEIYTHYTYLSTKVSTSKSTKKEPHGAGSSCLKEQTSVSRVWNLAHHQSRTTSTTPTRKKKKKIAHYWN